MSAAATHRWRSELLGDPLELELDAGTLRCHVRGDGPPVVLCHGWLANANLWRAVVGELAASHRCFALDLPLGAHTQPMDELADLSPAGCGALIAQALEALELEDVTLIGNDSGGAYSQIAVAARPERVGRLVLNSCETPYDAFPPPPFDGLPQVAQDERVLGALLGALRDPEVRGAPAAFGQLIKHPIAAQASDSYALPCLEDPRVLHDTAKVMASARSEPVHAAGNALIERFARPVLFIWGTEDRVFPLANARRYAHELADGRVRTIEDAFAFTPEDQPQAFVRTLRDFLSPE